MKSNPDSSSSDLVVQLEGVSRRYGAKAALNEVSLGIPRGAVLGLVGANGAGKTTLIKHVLGLLRAREGTVRVFGLDPVRDTVAVLGRLGYLSEDRDLPAWMSVGELLRYSRGFYPRWDVAYADNLRERFQLPLTSRIRSLSKGELAKAGLLVALAHRPELLVLDEPSSGLDPLVRRELLEAIVRAVADEGRTVLFSSHLLDEIARVSDRIALMSHGRLLLDGPLHEIVDRHRRWVIRLPDAASRLGAVRGVVSLAGGPDEWTVIGDGEPEMMNAALREVGAEVVESVPATFEEIFHARVKTNGAS